MGEAAIALVGAGVGGIIALVSTMYLEGWRDRRRHDQLRCVLLTYAKQMEEEARQFLNGSTNAHLSTEIWRSLSSDFARGADAKELRDFHRYFAAVDSAHDRILNRTQGSMALPIAVQAKEELDQIRLLYAEFFRSK